jgi:hypothetical protein
VVARNAQRTKRPLLVFLWGFGAGGATGSGGRGPSDLGKGRKKQTKNAHVGGWVTFFEVFFGVFFSRNEFFVSLNSPHTEKHPKTQGKKNRGENDMEFSHILGKFFRHGLFQRSFWGVFELHLLRNALKCKTKSR